MPSSSEARSSWAALFVSAALLVPTILDAGAAPGDGDARLVACQDAVRNASLRLGNQVRRRLGHCIERAMPCLLHRGDPSTCCATAAIACDRDQRKLATELARFRRKVERRGCKNVPFEDLLAETGLGYRDIAGLCGVLQPPVTLAGLEDLGGCLARAITRGTGHVLATYEIARGCDALRCMELDDVVAGVCMEDGPMGTGEVGR